MEIITTIARREGRCNDSTGLRVGTTVEVAALVALAGAVPALVGDSDTVAVAVKATAGVVVGTFTTVANTVGLGDAVGVGVDEATRVADGAGEEVPLGEGVNVVVEVATEVEVCEGVSVCVGDGVDVATKVEVGEGVSVWVGEAVDLAEASDARDVGVKVPSPAGVSRQPASPRTTNDARAIARYCRAKILPAVVERGVK